MAGRPSLTLKRRIKAPPEKILAAWTDPQKVKQWMGPEGVIVEKAENDARVGGRYRLSMRTPNGELHNVSGVYREVAKERLVFTWAWEGTPERESMVTLTVKLDGDVTMFTLTHEQFFDEEARDRHQQGWIGSIDKLEKYLG